MAKTITFFGVYTTDDERTGSIKAYCATRELAEKELKKYRDFYHTNPPKPDERHIIPLEMIVSDEN